VTAHTDTLGQRVGDNTPHCTLNDYDSIECHAISRVNCIPNDFDFVDYFFPLLLFVFPILVVNSISQTVDGVRVCDDNISGF
jgi:hypothetical protein